MDNQQKIDGLEFEFAELQETELEAVIGGKWYPGKRIVAATRRVIGGGRSRQRHEILPPGMVGTGFGFHSNQAGNYFLSGLLGRLFGGFF